MNGPSLRDVLVVDDNDSLREGVADFLRLLALDVDTACDGREALDQLAKAEYAVMLLDYEMPDVNGLAVVKEVRHFSVRPVILMMTGHEDVDTLPIDGSVVQGVLRKPFDVPDVAEIIRSCVAAARNKTGVPVAGEL